MMKVIAGVILRLMGWKIHKGEIHKISKAVLVVAPHTSMTDFLIGRLAFYQFRLPIKFLIKNEMFWFPLGYIIKVLGGMPVNRKNPAGIVNEISDRMRKSKKMFLAITPEGTRKLTYKWKRGFYQIADKANVPIVLAYVDYRKKEGGVGPIIYPTGDYENDLNVIQQFYKDITPKYPENFQFSCSKKSV